MGVFAGTIANKPLLVKGIYGVVSAFCLGG